MIRLITLTLDVTSSISHSELPHHGNKDYRTTQNFIALAMATLTPSNIKIRHLNVQHWTDVKHTALVAHLSETKPHIILFTSHSRTRQAPPIRIPFYNTFTTNKNNVPHAGSGIAILKGIKFDLMNNFTHDTIAAKIQTAQGPIIVMTNYSPPRQRFLPNLDLEFMIRHQTPTILSLIHI